MTDQQTFEHILERRLRAHAATADRPYDAAAIARAASAQGRRSAPRANLPRAAAFLTRRVAIAATIALLIAALVAAALVGSRPAPARPPGFLGADERLLVAVGGTVNLLRADGSMVTTQVTSRVGSCPLLIGGTTVVATQGYGKLPLTDLTGAAGWLPGLTTGYDGGERWSADFRHLARMDFSGPVTLDTFDSTGHSLARTVDAPGVFDVAWVAGGDRAVIARVSGSAIEIITAAAPPGSAIVRRQIPIDRLGADQASQIVTSAAGSQLAVVRVLPRNSAGHPVASLVALDLETGTARTLFEAELKGDPYPRIGLSAWSPDGSHLAAVTGPGALTIMNASGTTIGAVPSIDPTGGLDWSPAGLDLSIVAGSRLTVVDVNGGSRREVEIGDATVLWERDGSAIFVARRVPGGAIKVERRATSDLAVAASRLFQFGPDQADASLCLQLDGPGPP